MAPQVGASAAARDRVGVQLLHRALLVPRLADLRAQVPRGGDQVDGDVVADRVRRHVRDRRADAGARARLCAVPV